MKSSPLSSLFNPYLRSFFVYLPSTPLSFFFFFLPPHSFKSCLTPSMTTLPVFPLAPSPLKGFLFPFHPLAVQPFVHCSPLHVFPKYNVFFFLSYLGFFSFFFLSPPTPKSPPTEFNRLFPLYGCAFFFQTVPQQLMRYPSFPMGWMNNSLTLFF